MANTLVVNLFGVPGAGKSTGAAYIFSCIKMAGINAELITEYAKDKVWERNDEAFRNQAYIFGEQSYRISRCAGKVDVIVTDSPLPLSVMYNNDERLTENFNKAVMDVFNTYDNLNYLLLRVKPYNPVGRKQTEAESDALGASVISLLKNRNIPYRSIEGDVKGYDEIVREILLRINGEQIMNDITEFRGNNYYLSNFYERDVTCFGLTFKNNEAAFHAMKCPERASEFCDLDPSAAKKLGRHVQLRPDWEQIKEDIMYEVCRAKFTQHEDLKARLLSTGSAQLIEGNDWNDREWGVCNSEGKNKLGKILMRIREELANA